MADSSRIVNVGVVDGGQKPHVGGLEWIAARKLSWSVLLSVLLKGRLMTNVIN